MLKEILMYQKKEIELKSLEGELEKCKYRENALKLSARLKKQQSEIISLEKLAKKQNELYNLAIKKYEEFSKKLDEFEKEISNADPDKSDIYEKLLNEYSEVGASLEKNIAGIYNEIQAISKKYEDIISNSKIDKMNFEKNKTAFSKIKAEKTPEIAKLKEEMASLDKKINAKIFEVYSHKRASNILPVFVPLDNNKCGGCRMEVSASKLASMKSSELGIVECENCGRYIYQE